MPCKVGYSKEANVETALVDHEEQFEPAINTDNMSDEEDLLINSRDNLFINFPDIVRTPIKDQSGTIPPNSIRCKYQKRTSN